MGIDISAIMRLLQLAWSGLSSILPTIKRGDGDASRKGANTKSITEGDITSLISGKVTESNITVGNVNQITQVFNFQTSKRQNNVRSVVEETAKLVEGKDVPDTPIDHDWTARFFNYIQDVSSDEMQELWTHILAGEVERPGGTSLKTLSILRDMNHDVARLFLKLCSCCMSLDLGDKAYIDGRVCSLGGNAGSNSLQQYGLGFDSLNTLNEYGLIIGDYHSYRDYGLCIVAPTREVFLPFKFQNQSWILVPGDSSSTPAQFNIHGPALTKSGRELSRIVKAEPTKKYYSALEQYFGKSNLIMTPIENQIYTHKKEGKS